VVYWLIALASLIAWARFCTYVSDDVTENLPEQPDVAWKMGMLGVLLVMFVVWLAMPSFWAALPVNLVLAAAAIGAYWMIRVKTLGSKGHLFSGTLQTMAGVSNKMDERRSAKQVQLTYLRGNDEHVPLPQKDDPLAAGLATADEILIQALVRRADMVELAPTQGGYALNFLVDGVAYSQPAMTRTVADSAIQAFKVVSGLAAEERRRPQTGKVKTKDGVGTITTWTVRSSGTTAGERMTVGANEKGRWDLRLDGLGLASDQLKEVKEIVADTKGLVLVTSPKGQGRTSSMYALLRQHDAFMNSLALLETDPQAEVEGATATRFEGRGNDATYSKTLQSIFLKDPNIVLVSQVGDPQTADTITRFLEEGSGHARRVYAGMNVADTLGALQLWMSLNSDKSAAIDVLRMIIAERLVRILCPTCKIPYQPDQSTLKRLNLPVGRNLQSFKANTAPIVDKKGNSIICPDCGGTGFHGRTGIFEVMMVNDELKKALAGNANENQIKTIARKNHMILLVEHGIRKFASGITAINEVTRVLGEKSPAKQNP
jgi:type II secretory ATPase GspE/PulE/Tfp pilus assembly ATPase PilB-like protein